MRLMSYQYTISYIPGKSVITADTLLRAPVKGEDIALQEDTEVFVNYTISNLQTKMQEIQKEQEADETCKFIRKYCQNGRPAKRDIPAQPYFLFIGELSVNNGILMKGCQSVIPKSLRSDVIQKYTPSSSGGIVKCRRESVWWPGLGKEVEERLKQCSICIKESYQQPEPLIPVKFHGKIHNF